MRRPTEESRGKGHAREAPLSGLNLPVARLEAAPLSAIRNRHVRELAGPWIHRCVPAAERLVCADADEDSPHDGTLVHGYAASRASGERRLECRDEIVASV